MLKIVFPITLILLALPFYGLCQTDASPNTTATPSVDWIRVQSDDGEFSIEVPAKYRYFYDAHGFYVSEMGTSSSYRLRQMRMLSSFANGTSMSFECYQANKGALNAIYTDDVYKKSDIEKSEIKSQGYSIKQVIQKDQNRYSVRQYLYSKKNIYILTAASRTGETEELKRFLGSMSVSESRSSKGLDVATKLSSLVVTPVNLEMKLDEEYPPAKTAAVGRVKKEEDDVAKLTLINKPKPSYVDVARMKNIRGTVVLRAVFSADGNIPKITILRTLPEGLLRQTVFAAIRMKFLPVIRNGRPEDITKTIEYEFSIY